MKETVETTTASDFGYTEKRFDELTDIAYEAYDVFNEMAHMTDEGVTKKEIFEKFMQHTTCYTDMFFLVWAFKNAEMIHRLTDVVVNAEEAIESIT